MIYIVFGVLCLAAPLGQSEQPESVALHPTRLTAESFGPADNVTARDANSIGAQLYRKGDYDKAFPYLQKAARRGFKMAQARISHIYLNGLGGIEQNVQAGIGWLGVAAERPTSPEIRRRLRDLRTRVPKDQRESFDKLVSAYRTKYDPDKIGVRCTNERSAGSHISRLKCDYSESRNLDEEIQLKEEIANSLRTASERRPLTPSETIPQPATDRSQNIF